MEENNQSGGGKKLYIALILLLLLLNVIVGWMLYNEKKAKGELQVAKTEVDNQYATLKTDFETQKIALEEFKGKNAELDQIIVERQTQIDNQIQEIERLKKANKLDQAAVSKYKAMITQLEADKKMLAEKVDQLTKENADLTQIKEQLTTDLSNEKANTSKLSEEKAALSSKVELGKLLQANNLKVTGINVKNSGKEVETNKLKRTEKLKISWETGDNKVLDPGNVTLHVRIINPKGQTISLPDQGSGTIKTHNSESEIQFSRTADIDFQGSNKTVSLYWTQNIIDKGVYKVEIYQAGHLIGSGSTELE